MKVVVAVAGAAEWVATGAGRGVRADTAAAVAALGSAVVEGRVMAETARVGAGTAGPTEARGSHAPSREDDTRTHPHSDRR